MLRGHGLDIIDRAADWGIALEPGTKPGQSYMCKLPLWIVTAEWTFALEIAQGTGDMRIGVDWTAEGDSRERGQRLFLGSTLLHNLPPSREAC